MGDKHLIDLGSGQRLPDRNECVTPQEDESLRFESISVARAIERITADLRDRNASRMVIFDNGGYVIEGKLP